MAIYDLRTYDVVVGKMSEVVNIHNAHQSNKLLMNAPWWPQP